MYFRELPDPVVPTPHYHTMLEASVKVQYSKEERRQEERGCAATHGSGSRGKLHFTPM